MQGATLRRPLRAWLSTIASGGAIACALGLMSLADAGNVWTPAELVESRGSAPRATPRGGGTDATVGPANPPPTLAPAAPAATQTLVSKVRVPVPNAPRLVVAI